MSKRDRKNGVPATATSIPLVDPHAIAVGAQALPLSPGDLAVLVAGAPFGLLERKSGGAARASP